MSRAVIRSGRRPFFSAGGITCYILRGTRGELLIDTGLPQTWPAMKAWLAPFDIRYVFLTHAHADHDWNAGKLQRQGAKILLGAADCTLRRHFSAQPQQAMHPRWRLRTAVQGIGARFLKSPPYEPDILIDGDSGLLRTLGFDADIVALPGHTDGSLGIHSGNVLYCGDALTAMFGKLSVPPNVHDIAAARQSIRKIRQMRPEWIASGHGLPCRVRRQ